MPFTSVVTNTQLSLDAKKDLAAAITSIFVDSLKVRDLIQGYGSLCIIALHTTDQLSTAGKGF